MNTVLYLIGFVVCLVGVAGGMLVILRCWMNQQYEWLKDQFDALHEAGKTKVDCPVVKGEGGLVHRTGRSQESMPRQETTAQPKPELERKQGVQIIVGGKP